MVMRYFNVLIEVLIFLSLLSFAFETLPDLTQTQKFYLNFFEIFCIVIFTIEYIIRLIHGKLKYALSFFGIIDLLAILPFMFFFIPELSLVKCVRLVRILRMIKFARYFKPFKKILSAIYEVRRDLVVYTIFNFCLLYVLAVIMYYVEHDKQPEKFASILHSLWWAVVTLTTIGYGDVVPQTVLGKIITSFIAAMGIGIITIPTGLIAATLIKGQKKKKIKK